VEPARYMNRFGLWIYIAGPFTKGGELRNVYRAIHAGERMRKLGLIPIVPHLSAFWDIVAPGAEYEDWMALDLKYIERCDMLLRLPGESPGSDREVAHAQALGKRVFMEEGDVYAWVRGQIE
jgi:hypothetical protein